MTAATRTPIEHRWRTASALVALLGCAWGFFFVFSVAMDRPSIATVHASAMLAVLALFLLTRDRRRMAIRVHGAAAITVAGLMGVAMFSGQGGSLACWYLPLIPMFVAIVAGWRGVLGWALVGVGAVGLIHLSEGVVTVSVEHEFTILDTQLGSFALVLLALGYLAFVQRLAEEQMEALEHQRETIGGQNDELAKVHAELARLHEDAMRESNAKTRLMARVSHEIRTPLNGLLGLSGVLADAPLDPAHLEMVRSLHASASALRQLVDDLLDVTRIQDGRMTLHVEPTDLRELLGDVVDMFGVLAHDKGVALAAVVDATVPARVSIDGLRVRQIAANLVGNALKFTTHGEVVVHVSGSVTRDRTFEGRVEVSDTGPGIEKDLLPRMFEAFEQAEDDVPLRRQGTGLGLWISRELARALGGELGATSERGRGSVFHFTFRASGSQPSATMSSAMILAAARVLVIEPHAASRRALKELADAAGFELHLAGSLADAMSAIRARPPDIVIVAAQAEATERVTSSLATLAPDAKLVLARSAASLSEPLPPGYVAAMLKPYRASRVRGLLIDVLPEESSDAAEEPVPRMRCLVVDDDETNRMVARLLLERAGQEVILAPDTASAEKILRGGRVDVVFQDVHLPEEDGIRFVTRLRSDFDQTPPLWIVALTAATSERERRAFDEAGMDDFLAKPIEVGLLRAALERAHRATRRRRRTSAMAIPRLPRTEERLLDPDVFDTLHGNLEEDMEPLVEEFIEGSAEHVKAAREGLAEGDTDRAHRAMHTLKSSAALLGAARLAHLARELERRIQEGAAIEPARLDELARCRDTSVERIRTRLRSLVR
ncbi:MAG: response regulator [Sandaracinaceae bacterium]|nr:response regulator [Sandaracinaceae bacterium]